MRARSTTIALAMLMAMLGSPPTASGADVVDLSVAGIASAQASDIVATYSNRPVEMPDMSLTVVTAGGPVLVLFFGEALRVTNTGPAQPVEADIAILGPNGWLTGASLSFSLGYGETVALPVSLQALDMPVAGTHTYTVTWVTYGFVTPAGPQVLLHYRGLQIVELAR